MARKKIGLIGAGNIGGELANLALTKQLGDIVLFDIPAKENFAKGKALDLEQSSTLSGADGRVSGTSDWADLAGADSIQGLQSGVQQDVRLWENKIPRAKPVFCEADTYLAEFRRWTRQFSSDPA